MTNDCIIFTPEKHIALLRYFIQTHGLCIKPSENGNFYMEVIENKGNGIEHQDFATCFVDLINSVWNDLSDTDKENITKILTHSGQITEENFQSALQEIRDLNEKLMDEYPECSEYCDRISKILNPPQCVTAAE